MKRSLARAALSTLLAALALSLSACGTGASAPEPAPAASPTAAPEAARWRETMENSAGDIALVLDAAIPELPEELPSLLARPRFLTLSQAKIMARALFGDAPLYEHSREETKRQIAEQIEFWEYGVTDGGIRAEHGAALTDAQVESIRGEREKILEYYRNAYALARDDIEPVPCQWRFWPSSHYGAVSHDYAGTDVSYGDELPDGVAGELQATAVRDGLSYRFGVWNWEEESFRNHALSVYAQPPGGQDAYLLSGLHSQTPPTDAELSAALSAARRLAEQLDIGVWELSAQARTWTDGSGRTLSTIQISGQPVYEGAPVPAQPGVGGRSMDAARSNYYLEALTIEFSHDGRLIELKYTGPLEITQTQRVACLDWEELAPRIREALRALTTEALWDYDAAGAASYYAANPIERTQVSIHALEVGLARLREDETLFRLVPSITLRGERTAYFADGHSESYQDDSGSETTILLLSLTDGGALRVR